MASITVSAGSYTDAEGNGSTAPCGLTAPSTAATVVSTDGGRAAFVEGANFVSTPVAVDSGITVSDADNATLASATVAQAFGMANKADLLQRHDPGPFVAASGLGMGSIVLLVFVLIVVMALMGNCSGSSGGAYRSSGGSMGGYTSGGGHK